jgi:BASS family bile acid:Na+ symporter
MLGMGLTLQASDFKQILKQPKWVLVGIGLQFILMPSLGWGLGKVFDLPPFFAVGLILVSCCPGGTASNVIAYLAKANVALSVCMTTVSTLAAILLTPYLTSQLSGSYVNVDAAGLFYSTLKVVLLPILLGVILNRYLPKVYLKNSSVCPTRCGAPHYVNRGEYYRTRKRNYFEFRDSVDFGSPLSSLHWFSIWVFNQLGFI